MQQLTRSAELTVSDILQTDRKFLSSWRRLQTSLLWILLSTLLCGAAGLFITLKRTPIYQSSLKLEVQQVNSNFLSGRDVNPSEPAHDGPTAAWTYLETQVQILKTEALIERVLNKIGPPPESRSSSISFMDKLRARLMGERQATSEKDAAVTAVVENLKVSPAPQGYVIDIEYDSSDPEYAARFVNALSTVYTEENLQARWSSSQKTAEWLRKKLVDLKGEMESAEAELQRYSTKSGLLMTEEKHVVAEEKLRQIQQELSTVQAERMSRESQFNTARSAPADSLPAVLDHGPLRELQLKLTELRRQLAEMSSLLTPTNYKVQRVQAQIAELENALKSERSRVLERLKNEFETASYRQALLKSAYEKQVQAVTDQARLKIRYDTLKHNAESSRTLYADLLQKVNTVGIISAIPASNVRVIEAGRVPSAPYKPVPLLGAILGGLAGLVLSSSIIILRYITDGSLRRPGEASQYLQVKELGAIPTARISAPDLHHARRLNGSSTHRRLSSPGAGLSVGGVFTSPVSNVTNGMLIDSLEAISASILFSSTRSSAIVVTSPRAKEGKTTISSHLAVSLAETGRRVLLVDGDMRAPRLHEIFDLPNEPGLGEMLTAASRKGQMDPASYAHQTSIPGLYVLTSGSWPNSSALFQEPLLNALFRQFRSNFDVTLMDTPPMLLTPVARLLGRSADAVALVLRAGKTSLETAMLCQQRLEHDGANLLGTILNDWNPESKVYEYYSAKR